MSRSDYMLTPEFDDLDDLLFDEFIPRLSENVVEINPLPPITQEAEEIFIESCVKRGILVKKIKLVK